MAQEYRGYVISVRRAGSLWANIRPKNHTLHISEIPQATFEEGEAILLERAKACIDADILKIEAAQAKRSEH